MDNVEKTITALIISVLVIFCATLLTADYIGATHAERMADKGYCQTPILGSRYPVWTKCGTGVK